MPTKRSPGRQAVTASPVLALALIALSAPSLARADADLPLPDLPSVPAIATVKPVERDAAAPEKIGRAVITPLSDLNVVQESIPAVLKDAARGPYRQPTALSCEALQADIEQLDKVLGPDVDALSDRARKAMLDKGLDVAESQGVSAVKRTMEGVVPFRSWVRKLSGAEKHDKAIATAIQSGIMRRSWLKGIRLGLGCPPLPPVAAVPAPAASTMPLIQSVAPASAASAP